MMNTTEAKKACHTQAKLSAKVFSAQARLFEQLCLESMPEEPFLDGLKEAEKSIEAWLAFSENMEDELWPEAEKRRLDDCCVHLSRAADSILVINIAVLYQAEALLRQLDVTRTLISACVDRGADQILYTSFGFQLPDGFHPRPPGKFSEVRHF